MNQPQNIEAEQSILSACILYPDMAEEAVSLLRPSDFYPTLHQKIFESIQHGIESNTASDAIFIANDLKSIPGIGGKIAEIIEAPIAVNIKHYARILTDLSAERKTIELCHKTLSAIQNGEQISDVLNDFQNSALSLGAESKESFTSMHDLTNQSIDRYEELVNQHAAPGIKTGYPILDYVTGGFKGSKLIIIAARPSVGKTAFMCNLAENMARAKRRVGIFELEMDKEDLDDRWMSSLSGINSVRLSTPPLKKENVIQPEEWKKITDAAAVKAEWPIIIDDTGGMSVAELKRRARKMKKMGAEIIFIDQLSEIKGNSRKSLFESNTEIVEELGRLKKELRIPIVLLAQINRNVEARDDKEPRLSDLKNTGMLEEKADMVLLGYRKYVYTEDPADENHAQWHLAKHRGGPVRKIEMRWEPKLSKFQNIAPNDRYQYAGEQ